MNRREQKQSPQSSRSCQRTALFSPRMQRVLVLHVHCYVCSRSSGHDRAVLFCNSLLPEPGGWSRCLSLSYFSGTGPDQYCILSALSKPSREGNHSGAELCNLLEQINTLTVLSFVPSPALRCSACSTWLLKGLFSLLPIWQHSSLPDLS